MTRLVRGELVKVGAGRTWWVLLAVTVGYSALMLVFHASNARAGLTAPPLPMLPDISGVQAQALRQQWAAYADPTAVAANLYTAGTTVGWLVAALMGILIVSREFRYRTAATTFVRASRRRVLGSKFAAAAVCAAGLWLASTIVTVLAGAASLRTMAFGNGLSQPAVLRAIGLNLFAYAAWAVIGVALGTVWRRQVPLIATTVSVYLLGVPLIKISVLGVSLLSNVTWISTALIALPNTAAEVMTTGTPLPGNPPPWIGILILASYVIVAAAVSLTVINRRDITSSAA